MQTLCDLITKTSLKRHTEIKKKGKKEERKTKNIKKILRCFQHEKYTRENILYRMRKKDGQKKESERKKERKDKERKKIEKMGERERKCSV